MRPIQKCYSNYILLPLLTAGLLFTHATYGGAQTYQPLSASVQISLNHSISDQAPPTLTFASQLEYGTWLNNTSHRLEKRIPDEGYRVNFLKTVYYEATRAGLDPQLVLGLIQVESGFKKYAVSSVGARGYMQVTPFWLRHDRRLVIARVSLAAQLTEHGLPCHFMPYLSASPTGSSGCPRDDQGR